MIQEKVQLINYEELTELIHYGNFKDFFQELIQYKDFFTSDSKLKKIVSLFEAEFLKKTENLDKIDRLKIFNTIPSLLHTNSKLFSRNFINIFIHENINNLSALISLDKNIKRRRNTENQRFSVMSLHPEHPTQKKTIKELRYKSPVILANAIHDDAYITSNDVSDRIPKIISRFKSPQEKHLHKAIENKHKNLEPNPNVALSNIIDFDSIKSKLNKKEQDYFLKASIDCVAYDGDIPKYCFELDSSFHDSDRAKFNDKMKNVFCEISNVELIRIRPVKGEQTSVKFFEDKLKDIII